VSSLADAYSATGAAWQAGPGRIYDRLAAELVARCPGGVHGRDVLDVGAGTGAASRAALDASAASVVAIDIAAGMLAHERARRPPAVVGDSRRLPFRRGSFGAVLAAFSLNHLDDPVAGLIEAQRVLAPGGGLAVSTYAADDTHPVKAAVEAASARRCWSPPAWYAAVRDEAVPLLATPDRALAAADAAGLVGASVEVVRTPFPDLAPEDLVAWRLGMAQMSGFVAQLTAGERDSLIAEALDLLGDAPPLVRSYLVLTWQT
jgi:SAM-dependent methyltransferase